MAEDTEFRRRHIRQEVHKHRFDAVIFDLDGVVTDTAAIHAEAWKTMFDQFLYGRAGAASGWQSAIEASPTVGFGSISGSTRVPNGRLG